MSVHNHLLRTAREQLPSLLVPGACASRAEVAEAVNRNQFLTGAFGVGAGALVAPPADDSMDPTAAVSAPTAHYRRLESTVATGQLARAVEAHLGLATEAVARHDSRAGHAALAEAAGLAAWLAADRHDTGTARRRYRTAIEHAERADHDLLTAYMRGSLGQFAVETGDINQGLRLLARTADELPQRAPDAARAWLASLRAQGLADQGNADQSRRALRHAEELAGRDRAEVAWPWLFPFGIAKTARHQADTFARLGDARAARDAYESAGVTLAAPKPRAMAQLAQARVRAGAGRVDEGCRFAAAALRVGHAYGSERILAGVRNFRATLPSRSVETAELDTAITELYEGDSW